MPEQEFELYLSLLGRFLRLNAGQREEIADELRDHLEERFEELARAGLDRKDAIRRAIEEFGDATDLAAHFTQLANRRKRRLIMRVSIGSVVVTTVAILIGSALWPEFPGANMPARAVGQQQSADANVLEQALRESALTARDEKTAAIEAKLQTPISVKFADHPLDETLAYISDAIEVDIIVDELSLRDEGIELNEPVTLELKYAEISSATALELVLEPFGLTYRLRDQFIHVQTQIVADENLEIRVYNCRDLLQDMPTTDMEPSGTPPAHKLTGIVQAVGHKHGGLLLTQLPPGGGKLGSSKTPPRPLSPGEALVDVVMTTTEGPWEHINGNGGTITEFNGLLIVRQTQAIHAEIQELLEMMRIAASEDVKRF